MGRQNTIPNGYYSAAQAKRRLGRISDGLFRYWIAKGTLERIVPEGTKLGYYRKDQVDKLAFDRGIVQTHLKFRQLTDADIPEVVGLLIKLFGGSDATIPRRRGWCEKNNETGFVVTDNDRIVGVVYLMPLTKEKLNELMSQIEGSSTRLIDPLDVQEYKAGDPVYLYILSMGVESGGSKYLKRARGARLVSGLLNFVRQLGERGIYIDTIASRSETLDGISILRKIGFTELRPSGTLRNFVIDVQNSGIRFLEPYHQAYERSHQ